MFAPIQRIFLGGSNGTSRCVGVLFCVCKQQATLTALAERQYMEEKINTLNTPPLFASSPCVWRSKTIYLKEGSARYQLCLFTTCCRGGKSMIGKLSKCALSVSHLHISMSPSFHVTHIDQLSAEV